MPHPTTMQFAWDKEVQRCSQILMCAFMLAVIVLMGGAVLFGHAQHAISVVAEERLPVATTDSEAMFSHD